MSEKSVNKKYEQLFRKDYKSLVYAALRICNDRPLAEDIVQQVFLTFMEKKRIDTAKNPSAYLRKAVVTRTINALRDRKKIDLPGETILESAEQQILSDSNDDLSDIKKRLHKAIDALPNRARLILVLHRFEGLSYKEIAAELQISPKTVENQLARALKLLRSSLPYTLSVLAQIYSNIF